jgi:hypothetical protein
LADPRDGGEDWTDPLDDIDFEEFQLGEPGSYEDQGSYEPSYQAAPPALVTCPSCGAAQPATNRHCEQCGARLSQAPLPVAPRPLAGVTAGTRALTIILGVLAAVVVLALGFQFFGGDDDATAGGTTPEGAEDGTTATTAPDVAAGPIEQIIPIRISCSSQLNDTTLACDNLIDGDELTDWNDASLTGEGAQFNITFADRVQLQQIHFTNLSDDVRFRRNYRIRTLEIITDDLPGLPIPAQLENDNQRPQVVQAPTLGTTTVTIRVLSTWPSEAVDGRAFDELALSEIEFWGRVVTDAAPESDNTNGTDGTDEGGDQ